MPPLDKAHQLERRARTIVEGQFSMPYAAAVALLRGQFGWDDYDLLGDAGAEAVAARSTSSGS